MIKHEAVKSQIPSATQKLLDPFQFDYQPSRGVDDAILTPLNMVYRHLEGAKNSMSRFCMLTSLLPSNTI
jgi:hypothetical protein